MVENDDVIYEEIHIQQFYQHERSRSAPDLKQPYRRCFKRPSDINSRYSVRNKTRDNGEFISRKIEEDVLLYRKLERTIDCDVNVPEISSSFNDHNYQANDPTLPISEISNSDTSIYMKMNCISSSLQSNFEIPLNANSAIETAQQHYNFPSKLEDNGHYNNIDKGEAVEADFGEFYNNISTIFKDSRKSIQNTITSDYKDGQDFAGEFYDNVSPPAGLFHFSDERVTHNTDELYTYISHDRHHRTDSSSTGSSLAEVPIISRSAEELGKKKNLIAVKDNEDTIYAEIVTNNEASEMINSRITRESDNLVLRNGFLENVKSSVKRTASLSHLDRRKECMYGEIDHVNTRKRSSRNRKKRPQSLYIGNPLKSEVKPRLNKRNSSGELYENSFVIKSKPLAINKRPDTNYRHSMVDLKEWRTIYPSDSSPQNGNQTLQQSDKNTEADVNETGFYENIEIEQQPCEVDGYRERRYSKPIDILPNAKQTQNVNQPFSCSSSSKTSSPRDSTSSSISGDVMSFVSSPGQPPVLSSRKRVERYASWSNIHAFTGLNYFHGHYLGKHMVESASLDQIDFAISYVAKNTNVIEMKPVVVEINHEVVRFGSNSSTWDLLVTFPMEEIISCDVVLKNAYYFGIIAGKPGEEAYCYVLQSEKAVEMGEAIQEVFQTVSKIPRSPTFDFCPSIEPEFHRYHYLVQVGCLKVKKSFHNVNDYIKIMLEKFHPRDFKSVGIEIVGQNIVISQDNALETLETSHSSPSVLTLGVYPYDKRFFGYIISEFGKHNKTRVQCYVYRAARHETAAKIVTAISQSCQSTFTPCRTSNCEMNPIYVDYKAAYASISPRGSLNSTVWSDSTSPNQSLTSNSSYIRQESSETNDIHKNVQRHSSTETLLKLTPSSSMNLLPRSSPVTTEKSRLKRAVSHDELKSTAHHGNAKLERSISHQENPIYQFREEIKPPENAKENLKENKKPKHKRLFGKLKKNMKHKSNGPSLDNEVVYQSMADMKPEIVNISAFYVCSTLISPPLKQKHIKECFKQYNKEMNKAGKLTSNSTKTIGSPVSLEIHTNNGISMLDPNQSDTVLRHFPIHTFEMYVKHPEDEKCFGFSTSVLGNVKHKCHLFHVKSNYGEKINNAYSQLAIFKKLLG